MNPSPDRRRLLTLGASATVVALAGCANPFGASTNFDDDVPAEVADHLDGANNVDGSVTDLTGEDSVTIEVGPGGKFAYDPALARIDAGTEVTWEWMNTGHTVTSESIPGETEFDESRGEFTQLFETAGNVLYFCRPHRGQGHRGALIVAETE